MSKKTGRAKIEKLLDKAWSEFIRGRDKTCQKCGSVHTIAGHHAFGRRHRATRWDAENGVGLCYPCHINWAHRDPAGFSVWFRGHVGVEQFERLAEAHSIPTKHTMDDLRSMLEWFNNRPEGQEEER